MFNFAKFFKRILIFLLIISCLATFYSNNLKTNSLMSKIDLLLQKPELRAFLDTIAYAEGTYNQNGYKTLFAGHIFKEYTDHPRIIVASKSYANPKIHKKLFYSTAAGRYQILERIWDDIAQKLNLKTFEPINQDRAAAYLIRQNGVLKYILNNNFELAAKKLHKIYPAFPGLKYKQPSKDIKELKNFYEKRLKFYREKK